MGGIKDKDCIKMDGWGEMGLDGHGNEGHGNRDLMSGQTWSWDRGFFKLGDGAFLVESCLSSAMSFEEY